MEQPTDKERELVAALIATGLWRKLTGVMIYGRWLKGGPQVNGMPDPLTHPDAHGNARVDDFDLMPGRNEQSTICHHCGRWISAAKAIYFDDESSYCPHHAPPQREKP